MIVYFLSVIVAVEAGSILLAAVNSDLESGHLLQRDYY